MLKIIQIKMIIVLYLVNGYFPYFIEESHSKHFGSHPFKRFIK